MSRVLSLLAAIALVGFADAPHAAGNESVAKHYFDSLCLDSTAGTGVDLTYFKTLASSTNPQDTLIRHGLLPSVSSASVGFVRDTMLCRRTAESLRRLRFGTDTGVLVPLELFQYGSTRYLSSWPIHASEFRGVAVFDTTFTFLGLIMQ